MAISLEEFRRAVCDSGVLSSEAITAVNALVAAKRPADAEQLARLLVREKKLTAFQAQQIYAGRGSKLKLGNYVLLDKLGQGGMGVVYKAEHARMHRVVALKTISRKGQASSEALQRFHREMEVAARLRHPHIVTAYDAAEADGTTFLVLEYVAGDDLASLVKRNGPLSVGKALHCVLQAAEGLAYAHAEGVVHRDIKPANLLLNADGNIKILDMGLARLTAEGDQAALTGTDQVMGTVDFMAPEQARNTRAADGRADIYSLGMTLWYLLIGRAAYEGDTLVSRVMAHQQDPIPSLRAARPNVSEKLEQVFTKMVAKRPEDRFSSMPELLVALNACRSGDEIAPTLNLDTNEESKLGEFLRKLGPPPTPAAGGSAGVGTAGVLAPPARLARTVPTAPREETIPVASAMVDTDPETQQSLAWPKELLESFTDGDVPWWRRPVVWLAAGAAGIMLLLGIWVIVRDKDGNVVAQIEAPAGGSATVTPDRQNPPPAVSIRKPPTPSPTAIKPNQFCLQFLGDSRVEIPSLKFNYAGPVTFEGFFTPHAPDNGRVQNALGPVGYGLYIAENGTWSAGWVVRPPPSFRYFHGARALAKKRVHLAAVRNAKDLILFVDGVIANRLTIGPQPDESSSGIFRLGDAAYVGLLDEIRISSAARYEAPFTPPDPDAHFAADANTIALYHCDEGTGDVLHDASPNKHDAKLVGTKWVRSELSEPKDLNALAPPAPSPLGPGNRALWFEGGDWLVNKDLQLDARRDITIEGSFTPRAGEMELLSISFPYQLGVAIRKGRWSLEAMLTGGIVMLPAEAVKAERRTHAALVRKGQRLMLFVDGKLVQERDMGKDNFFPQPHPFAIGHGGGGGAIDEVRVSSVARYDRNFTPPGIDDRFTPDDATLVLYHFDEGVGTIAKDSSSKGHDGALYGATWVPANATKTPAARTDWHPWPTNQPLPAIAPFDAAQAAAHQAAWAKHLDARVTFQNSVGLELVLIPPGQFLMGENGALPNHDEFGHEAVISKPYWLGKYEVTVGQFRQFVKERNYKTDAERGGGGYGWDAATKKWGQHARFSWQFAGFPVYGDDHPVVNVSWNDAQVFCEWLSAKEGARYRLPTETEWEMACRAGSTTRWHWGADYQAKKGNGLDASAAEAGYVPPDPARRESDGFPFTAPVGSFPPNAFGLHETTGNVWEWCENSPYSYSAREVDAPGPREGPSRALRGGCWDGMNHSSDRHSAPPASFNGNNGFRVVRIADATPASAVKRLDDRQIAEVVLKAGGSITIEAAGKRSDVAALPLPTEPVRLLAVNVGGKTIDTSALATIGGARQLEWLEAGYCNLTDEQTRDWGPLPDLIYVCFWHSRIGKGTIDRLEHSTKLRTVRLDVAALGKGGLDGLRNATEIDHLTASGCGLGDDDIRCLARATKLREVILSGNPLGDATCEFLAGFPLMESITLGGTKITDQGLSHLARCPKLRVLWLQQNRLSTKGFEQIMTFANLHRLALDQTPLRGFDFAKLESLAQLEDLSVVGCSLEGDALARLPRLEHLRSLGCNLNRLSAASLAGLERQPALETLEIAHSPIGDEGARRLSKVTTLKILSMAVTSVSDIGLAELATLPKLEILSISGNRRVTDTGLAALAKCPTLKHLHVGDTSVTQAGVERLRTALPKCQIFFD